MRGASSAAAFLVLAIYVGCGRIGYDHQGVDAAGMLTLHHDAGSSVTFDSGLDAAARDSGPAFDAGVFDAGTFDAGVVDGARPDTGTDSGRDAGRDASAFDAGPAPMMDPCFGLPLCPGSTHCDSTLGCHPVLFSDDFEDGVIDPIWTPMRFVFQETGGHLQSTSTIRPGFMYGPSGSGRSAIVLLHIGDTAWTDYRVDWTQQTQASLTIVDPGLAPCQHTPVIFYRVASYSESWNAPENTHYTFSIDQGCMGPLGPTGSWGLGVFFRWYIPGVGYSSSHLGTSYGLVNGTTAVTDTPLHMTLEVRATHARLWIEGRLVFDEDDSTYAYATGDSPILSGGVGFTAAWEQMFWIDDVTVTDLTH